MTDVAPSTRLLTAREAECVRMLADGLDDVSSGNKLGISPRTVRFHIDNAKTKLKALTRCNLVAIAIKSQEIPR